MPSMHYVCDVCECSRAYNKVHITIIGDENTSIRLRAECKDGRCQDRISRILRSKYWRWYYGIGIDVDKLCKGCGRENGKGHHFWCPEFLKDRNRPLGIADENSNRTD